MSQTSSGLARLTRSTIKRALSVDDLDAVLQSAPADKFAANKTSEKALVFKRRRKYDKQLQQKQTSQPQQAQTSQPQDHSAKSVLHRRVTLVIKTMETTAILN